MSEDADVVGIAQFPRERVLCVVIAFDNIDGDVRLPQACRLFDKEQTGAGVGPVAIPEVARDHDESHRFTDREID